MEIVKIDGATRVLGKPADWDESQGECVELPIVDHPEGWMVSEWRPTQEELRALIEGGSIRLWVQGSAHPAVFIEAIEQTGAQVAYPTAQLEENAKWLRQTLESLKDTMERQINVCALALDATKGD